VVSGARRTSEGGSDSLSEVTYRRLRSDIVQGLLRPNERLIEAELAERLAVSRTPIRESLQRLAADGLVISRRRGWVVYEHTPDEIREIYEIRSALEGYATRLAAERATDEQLAEVVRILQESTNIARAPRQHMVEVNDRFHDAIIEACGNRRLAEEIRRNRLYYFNHRLANLYSDQEVSASRVQHDRIVRALLDRNPREAEEITRNHIRHALEMILVKVH
jgi:DNA-binding GntR family transcriptional regulator